MAKKPKPIKYPGNDAIKKMRKDRKDSRIAGRLQRELARRGCYDGEVTRRWDLRLKRAVRCFQRRKGLTADGVPGPATFKALGWPVPFTGSGNKDYPYVWFRPGVTIPPNKTFMKRLNRIGKEGYEKHGKRLVMVSGYRPCGSPSDSMYKSPATQHSLWKLYRAGKGNLAAVPCRSLHGKGYAADIGWEGKNGGGYTSFLNLSWARALAKKHVVCFPVPGERWHAQPGTYFAV